MSDKWIAEYLEFATSLYPIKALTDFTKALSESVQLLLKTTRAEAAAFVRLDDTLTARIMIIEPATFPLHRPAPEWIAALIENGVIEIGPLLDGPLAKLRQVAFPVNHTTFQGAFLAFCPAELCTDGAFGQHLERVAAALADMARTLNLRQELDELKVRHRAIMDHIPQGVVFIADNGRRACLNRRAAAMLQLPDEAPEPAAVAQAMRSLRESATNRAEIEETDKRVFVSPDQAFQNCNWILGDPLEMVLNVACLPVMSPAISGCLWVFSDMTREQHAITEKRSVQEELSEAEELLHNAFENAAVGMALIDGDYQFIQVNHSLCEMLGYSRAELLQKNFLELTHPADLEATRQRAELFHAGTVANVRNVERYIHRDGHAVWVVVSVSMTLNLKNEPLHALAQIIDISAQKEAKLALQESVDRLERMAGNLRGGLFFRSVHQPDGSRCYTWISTQVESLFGIPREEVLRDADNLNLMIEPEDLTMVQAIQAEAIRNRTPYEALLRVRTVHGTTLWVSLRGSPTFEADGSVTWDGFAMDVTALELTRQELARREAMLRHLGDNLPNGAIYQGELDAEGRVHITFASAGFEELTGISLLEIQGSRRSLSERTHPDDQRRFIEARQKSLARMEKFDIEVRMKGRNDVLRWVRIRSAPTKRPDDTLSFQGILLDVSEQKAMEESLRISEELFHAAFDNSATGIALVRAERYFFRVNRAFCRILGYEEAELIGKNFVDVTHPDDLEESRRLANSLWSGEVSQLTFEKRYKRKDGTTVWALLNLSLVRDESGRAQFAIAQIQDITARHVAEESLRISEERYRSVLDAQTELVSRYLPDGTLTYVNDVYCRFFGLRAEEHVGHKWAPSVWPEDLDRVVREVNSISVEKPIVLITNRVYNARGEVRWVEFVNQGFFDEAGNVREFQAVGRDVTDRVESENLLHQTVQRLKLATEAGSIGTWIWNFSDNTLEWDQYLVKWFELPKTKSPNYSFWRSRIHPDDAEEAERSLLRAKAENGLWDHRFRIVRSSGEILYIHAAAMIDHDANGRQTRMIGINRDVTQEHLQEEKLKAAKQEADAASLAKSEFLANMSHEVRSPLTAVLGYADMLMDPNLGTEAASQAVQAIRRNGSHLLAILNDILDLSKVEAGKLEIESINYAPWQLVKEVESLLKMRGEERQIKIHCRAVTAVPSIAEIDPTRVRQVLLNLVSNAVKFSEAGDTVEIRLAMNETNEPEKPEMTLEVEDEGLGMTPEQLQVIFQPFRQADSSTTRKYGGTGLGLSITRRLVELLGGRIEARSEAGRGSCFTVHLPVTIPAAPPAIRWLNPILLNSNNEEEKRPTSTALPAAQFQGRVLLAEDSQDNRRVISFMLCKFGLKPEIAANGQEAFHAALARPFDLILMDMQMPVMDGYDSTQALRRSGYKGKIVAMTAYSMREDRDKCLLVGCDDYLTKPVSIPKLAETLTRFLAKSSD